jgi:hypothetical protein
MAELKQLAARIAVSVGEVAERAAAVEQAGMSLEELSS